MSVTSHKLCIRHSQVHLHSLPAVDCAMAAQFYPSRTFFLCLREQSKWAAGWKICNESERRSEIAVEMKTYCWGEKKTMSSWKSSLFVLSSSPFKFALIKSSLSLWWKTFFSVCLLRGKFIDAGETFFLRHRRKSRKRNRRTKPVNLQWNFQLLSLGPFHFDASFADEAFANNGKKGSEWMSTQPNN